MGVMPDGGTAGGSIAVFDVTAAKARAEDSDRPVAVRSVPAGVVCIAWHLRIRQMAVGCTDGRLRVYFDPEISDKGALLSTVRHSKAGQSVDGAQSVNIKNLPVYNPNALRMYRNRDEALGCVRCC